MKPLDLPPHLFVGRSHRRGYGLFARTPIAAGQTVFVFRGQVVPLPQASPRAMQVGFGQSLESDRGFDDLLNHSCRPNCRVTHQDGQWALIAAAIIPAGDELTYDYETTEHDLEAQGCAFDCACSEACCRGRIVGRTRGG